MFILCVFWEGGGVICEESPPPHLPRLLDLPLVRLRPLSPALLTVAGEGGI